VFPAVSPDGRYIVFSSDRSGENNIWRIDSDGRNAVQLTHGTNEYHSSISADGQWVFYDTGQKSEVHKVPISGGESVFVIPGSAGHPIISPDGKLVAYTYYDEQQKEPWRLGVMRLDDNVLSRSWPQPFRCYGWTPGTLALTSIAGENTVSNLWSQPLDGTLPTQLTDFK
jgi:Tol biopolymer transport system component